MHILYSNGFIGSETGFLKDIAFRERSARNDGWVILGDQPFQRAQPSAPIASVEILQGRCALDRMPEGVNIRRPTQHGQPEYTPFPAGMKGFFGKIAPRNRAKSLHPTHVMNTVHDNSL